MGAVQHAPNRNQEDLVLSVVRALVHPRATQLGAGVDSKERFHRAFQTLRKESG